MSLPPESDSNTGYNQGLKGEWGQGCIKLPKAVRGHVTAMPIGKVQNSDILSIAHSTHYPCVFVKWQHPPLLLFFTRFEFCRIQHCISSPLLAGLYALDGTMKGIWFKLFVLQNQLKIGSEALYYTYGRVLAIPIKFYVNNFAAIIFTFWATSGCRVSWTYTMWMILIRENDMAMCTDVK